MFLNTVVATRNLLDALVATRAPERVVLVSSFGVYGMAQVREGAVVDERTPLEPHPERRDLYSHAKRRQEQLCWEYHERHGVPLTVLRPGVIYGPSGPAMSARVGLPLFGLFLHLGRRNLVPLTHVDNCADAVIDAGASPAARGQVYNVVDDGLPTAREFLARYRREVRPLRTVSLPLWGTRALARAVAWYHGYSRGQLPAIFTPYKTDAMWRSFRYDNRKLKSIGWRPAIGVDEGLRSTFAALRADAPR
jgi:nucleoside-diphosphate-sugar epimerase